MMKWRQPFPVVWSTNSLALNQKFDSNPAIGMGIVVLIRPNSFKGRLYEDASLAWLRGEKPKRHWSVIAFWYLLAALALSAVAFWLAGAGSIF
jgi:hypothetical protein